MKFKNGSAKRKLLTFGLFFILLGVLAYGTVAFYTEDSIATGVITAGNLDIKLIQQEKFGDDIYNVPFENITGVAPGQTVSRIVSVENCGAYAAYVRVSVNLIITLEKGYSISSAPENPVTVDFNTTDWTYNEDGYYYYNHPVEPGAATAPLFSTVSFSGALGKTFENSKANLKVDAYATQVVNNGANVFEAAGWPDPEE